MNYFSVRMRHICNIPRLLMARNHDVYPAISDCDEFWSLKKSVISSVMKMRPAILHKFTAFWCVVLILGTGYFKSSAQVNVDGFLYDIISDNTAALIGVENGKALSGNVKVPLSFDYEGNRVHCTYVLGKKFDRYDKIETLRFESDSFDEKLYFNASVFEGCVSLNTVDFPDRYMSFDSGIFDNSGQITDVVIRYSEAVVDIEGAVSKTPFADTSTVLYVPDDLIDAYKTNAKAKELFKNVVAIRGLSEYNEEDGNEEDGGNEKDDDSDAPIIEFTEYDGFLRITKVTLPEEYAGPLVIPARNDEVGMYYEGIMSGAFEGCYVSEIIVESDISIVPEFGFGQSAFKGLTSLRRVELPANTRVISTEVFSGCSSLTTVVIHTANGLNLQDVPSSGPLYAHTALLVEPDQYEECLKTDSWSKTFGRVQPISEGENLMLTLEDVTIRVIKDMVEQSVILGGCTVTNLGTLEKGLIESEGNTYTVCKPGGINLRLASTAKSGASMQRVAGASSGTISIGGASFRFSNLSKGDKFIISIPEGTDFTAGAGYTLTPNPDGTLTLEVDDPGQFGGGDVSSLQSGTTQPVVSFTREGDDLVVHGLPDGSEFSVFDLQGHRLYRGQAHRIALPTGTYAIIADGSATLIRF